MSCLCQGNSLSTIQPTVRGVHPMHVLLRASLSEWGGRGIGEGGSVSISYFPLLPMLRIQTGPALPTHARRIRHANECLAA